MAALAFSMVHVMDVINSQLRCDLGGISGIFSSRVYLGEYLGYILGYISGISPQAVRHQPVDPDRNPLRRRYCGYHRAQAVPVRPLWRRRQHGRAHVRRR